MRHHDQTGFSSKISKGLFRLLLELGIPDGRDFVGNIHVEIQCKRKGKLEASLHACRIGSQPLIKCISDLGNFLYTIDFLGNPMNLSMNEAPKYVILKLR